MRLLHSASVASVRRVQALVAVLATVAGFMVGVSPAAAEAPPTFTAPPASVTVAAGATASFSVAVDGDPVPDVTWERSNDGGATWGAVPDASGVSYSFATVATDHDARVRAVATSAAGSAVSDAATLSVTAAPYVVVDAVPVTAVAPAPAVLTATFGGFPTPTLQWEICTQSFFGWVSPPCPFGDWSSVGAAFVGTTLTYLAPTSSGNRWYRLKATSSSGTALSTAVLVRFESAPQPSTVQQLQYRVPGEAVSLPSYITALPTPTVTGWERSLDGTTWEPAPGAPASAPWNFTATADQLDWYYRSVGTNVHGTGYGSTQRLKRESLPAWTTQPPESKWYRVGASAPKYAATCERTCSYVTQQSSDGGATWSTRSASASITAADDLRLLRWVATNAAGSSISSSQQIRVGTLPTGTVQPVSQIVPIGGTVSLSVTVTGTPEPTIQWQRQAAAGASWVSVSGARSTTYTLPATAAMNGYRYRAQLVNAVGQGFSDEASLTTYGPVTVTSTPSGAVLLPGQTATFSATAAGAPVPTARWERSDDGVTWSPTTGSGVVSVPVAGGTRTTLSLVATAADDGDLVRAVFTNDYSAAASAPAVVHVLAGDDVPPAVAVTSFGPDGSAAGTISAGVANGPTTVRLTATDIGSGVASIEWSTSGAQVASPTVVAGSTVTIPVSVPGVTTVSWTARDVTGNASSGSRTVRVDTRPVVLVSPQTSVIEPETSGTTSMVFTIALDRAATENTVVTYYVADGTATSCASGTCDFTRFGTLTAPRTATIPAGSYQVYVGVPVRPDAAVEADETMELRVLSVSSNAVLGNLATATGTILDADIRSGGGAPVLSVTTSVALCDPDLGGGVKARVMVTLSAPLPEAITFSWSTSAVTALPITDYRQVAPTTVTMAAGTTSKTLEVLVYPSVGPNSPADRTFQVNVGAISSPPGNNLIVANTSSLVTIIDDDRL